MIKKSFRHTLKIILETGLVLFALGMIALTYLAFMLSKGPIDLHKFIPYAQEMFQKSATDQMIEIGSLHLEWQGIENPLGLSADNIVISNTRGPYLYAPEIDMDISLRSLLIGRLSIETLWVRRIALSITKAEDGALRITGQRQSEKNTTDMTPANLTLNGLLYDIPHFDILWIDKANIIYRDQSNDTTQTFDPVTLFVEMHDNKSTRSLNGFINFPFGDTVNKNMLKANFSTSSNPLLLDVSASFQKTPIDNFLQFLPSLPQGWDVNMVVDGTIQAQFNNIWNLEQLNINAASPRGQIYFPLNGKDDVTDVFDTEIQITQEPQSNLLNINKISTTLNETAIIDISGTLKNVNMPNTLAGDIKLSAKNLPQAYFKRYWPNELSDNGAHRWLTQKMSGGTFSDLNMMMDFDLGKTKRSDGSPLPPEIISVNGDFSYKDLNIDYNPPMSPATKVSGTGTYNNIELQLNVDSADIGGMITTNATLHFDDLITKGSGLGALVFPVQSPIQNIFDYIASEPIAAFKNIDFKPKNTKGDVDATVKISLPLLKDLPIEDIKVEVEGTVNNAEIPDAVKNLTLSGGPYNVFASTEEIKVTGSGQLSGKPITLDWHEYYSPKDDADYLSRITATVTANDSIRRSFTNSFADYFKGDTVGKITYIKSNNARDTIIDLNLDLKETAIEVPSIGLNKKYGVPANGAMTVKLKNGDLASVENINISGASASIADGNITFKTVNNEPYITSANLKNMRFNDNIMSVNIQSQGDAITTSINGRFLNAMPFMNKNKDDLSSQARASDARANIITINVNEMRTSEDGTIKDVTSLIHLDASGQASRLELDAKLGKDKTDGNLLIRYTPDIPDGLSLRVESNNAGETLRAFGLYPSIEGGQLQIAGKPIVGGRFGDVRGRARINDFTATGAPVLLRLVNALSFQNFMQAGAMNFKRLEADFEWQLGDNGDIYKISDGTTQGPSVAFTFAGYVDTTADKMDIQGTAAPLSELNSFIGKIPLLGQILTGGGALLAATYSISGTADNPSVAVNPLSILTPGIVRKMLFENTPEPKNTTITKPSDNQQKDRLN